MSYQQTLSSRGFNKTGQCRICGDKHDDYTSAEHPRIEIIVYYERGKVLIKYASAAVWGGKIEDLEANINEVIVKAENQ